MGKPSQFTWMAPPGGDLFAGDDALICVVARRTKEATEIPVLVFAIGVQRLFSFDARFHGSNEGVNELAAHEGRPMSWAEVEEIAAFVQSQGDEFLGCADRIRERWAVRTEIVSMEPPANATIEVVGVDLKSYETAQTRIAALHAGLAEALEEVHKHRRITGYLTPGPVRDRWRDLLKEET